MSVQCSSSWRLQGIASLVILVCASLTTSGVALSTVDRTFLRARTSRTSISYAGKVRDPKPKQNESESESILEDLNIPTKVPVIFPDELVERLDVRIALVIAFAWIGLIGSAPIAIHTLEHGFRGHVTKTMMALSVMMWSALFGGLYVFTNIVIFQSSHFSKERSLTVVECTYFMSQVITTVGYGDIVPAYPRGQVFVAVYAVFAFLVIAELMAELMKVVTEAVHSVEEESQRAVFCSGIRRPSMMPLLKSFALFGSLATIWVLFFHHYPGEGKSWMEAVYMAIITMSTIGLGAFTPVTEEGMIFGAFFMIFGAASLAKVVMDFSRFTLELSMWERWSPKWLGEHLKEVCNVADPSAMTEVQFISYTLIENRVCTKDTLDNINKAFKAMPGSRRGSVNLDSVQQLMGIPISPRFPAASESESEASFDAELDPESYRHRRLESTPRTEPIPAPAPHST